MQRKTAIGLVIVSTFFTASIFNAGKAVLDHLAPILAVTLRFSLASLLLLLIILPQIKSFIISLKSNFKIFTVLGLFGVTGCNLLFFMGLKHTSALNASIIVATTPIITMLLAALILKEPINNKQKIGLSLGFIGVLVVITRGSLDIFTHLQLRIGDSIILLANICWALYGILNNRYVKNSTPLITTTATMIIGSLFLILFTAITMQQQWWPLLKAQNITTLSLLLYIAIFGSVLAYLFWNYGIEQLGANFTTLFFNFIPIFTGLITFATGSKISTIELIGAALVIIGVLIAIPELTHKTSVRPAKAGVTTNTEFHY